MGGAGGRLEGQDAQSERPDVAIQYEELLGKSGEWRLGNDDANEHDKKQHREPSRVVRRACHTSQQAACLKDEEISTLPPVKSTQPKSASSKWTMPTAVVGVAPGGSISFGKAQPTAYVTLTWPSKTTPHLDSA